MNTHYVASGYLRSESLPDGATDSPGTQIPVDCNRRNPKFTNLGRNSEKLLAPIGAVWNMAHPVHHTHRLIPQQLVLLAMKSHLINEKV
jgi:hypothetical protein